jgi:hypothetical protein
MLPTPQLSATTPMTQTTLPCLDFLQAVHKQSNQFIPGHIRVDFHSHFAAMVPLQILPTRHYGTEWAAKDLSWESFVRLIEQKLGVTLQNRLLLAQVGQLQLYEIGEPGDWYEALQMCHDMGLRQCIFDCWKGILLLNLRLCLSLSRRLSSRCWSVDGGGLWRLLVRPGQSLWQVLPGRHRWAFSRTVWPSGSDDSGAFTGPLRKVAISEIRYSLCTHRLARAT